MRAEDLARMSWHARSRLQRRQGPPRPPVAATDIRALARRIQAALEPDRDAAAHVALLEHYTSKPRKRTA